MRGVTFAWRLPWRTRERLHAKRSGKKKEKKKETVLSYTYGQCITYVIYIHISLDREIVRRDKNYPWLV